jgi:single-stranded-DNA-specific exonuclease
MKAVEFMRTYVMLHMPITVVVDADADGFTSAAIFLNYMYDLYSYNQSKAETLTKLHYILHSGKQHGLEDVIDQLLEDDSSLVVIPDAGTNDVEQMQKLIDAGKTILCMDHHESDNWLKHDRCVIINNQICDYPNKDLSGAGVTWRICRAYDMVMGLTDLEGWPGALQYADLAALGNLSDMMDYRSVETKAIIDMGLQNIKNPFFYYMCEKNKFSIDKMGGINYMSMAFYVTPFINAIVRSGTMEEKDLVFKSMLKFYAFDKIESGKRGHKGELVPRVEEAVRIAANVKARQTKLQDAAMDLLEQRIRSDRLTENGIIICCCEPGEVEKNLAGLVANKIQAKYQHPCLVLTRSKGKDDKEYYYRGSARNYSMSEIEDMRQLCENTGDVEYAQGHSSAFGISIPESKLKDFIKKTNAIYSETAQEPVYWVDFEWFNKDIDSQKILTIAQGKEFWGQGLLEPYVAIRDIPLESVQLLSPDKHPTLKIHLSNGVDIMKFKSSYEEYEQFIKPNMYLTAVCRCAKNEWAGRVTAQLIIEDFYISEKWVF